MPLHGRFSSKERLYIEHTMVFLTFHTFRIFQIIQDGSGTISFEEFANGLLEIRLRRNAYSREEARGMDVFSGFGNASSHQKPGIVLEFLDGTLVPGGGRKPSHHWRSIPSSSTGILRRSLRTFRGSAMECYCQQNCKEHVCLQDALDAFSQADLGVTGHRFKCLVQFSACSTTSECPKSTIFACFLVVGELDLDAFHKALQDPGILEYLGASTWHFFWKSCRLQFLSSQELISWGKLHGQPTCR